MPLYLYFILLIVLSVIFILIRFFILQKKSTSEELFAKALRNENNGHFEDAIATYENALLEVKKIKHHHDLKNKIIDKLKLLHTIIEYNNGIRYKRL